MKSHLETTRNPQSEARRQHIHGRLLPAEPRPIISFLGQVMAVGLLLGSAWLLIVAFAS